ncbi:MAG: hypothetical protein WCL02_02765 [bacterium]
MREELDDIIKNLEDIANDTLTDTERKSRDRLYIQAKDLLEKNSTTTDQMERKIDEIESFYQQIHKRVKTESKEKKSSAEKKLDEAIKKLDDLKKQRESLEEKLENDDKISEEKT